MQFTDLSSVKVASNVLVGEGKVALKVEDFSGFTTSYRLNQEQAIQLAKDIQQKFPGHVPDQTVPISVITSLIDALRNALSEVEEKGYIVITTRTDAQRAIEKGYGLISIADPAAHAAYLQLTAAKEAHEQAKQRFSQAFSGR